MNISVDTNLRTPETEDTDVSYSDAVDNISNPAPTEEQSNDFVERRVEQEQLRVHCLVTEPSPLILLVLLCVPYVVLIYNSLHLGVSVYNVVKDVLAYAVYMVFFVLGLLAAVKLYCRRQRLLEWAVRLLYNYNGIDLPTSLESSQRCVGVQTIDNDFQRQVDALRNSHDKDMRRLRKHIHHMRKKFSQRVRSLKDLAKERNDILTKLQLRFPDMEHEKDTLVAERDAIEKQLEEEKRRNKELIGRFQRISQQFSRLGHAQYPPPLMSMDFHGQQ